MEDSDLLKQLFEEVVSLAEEENATNELQSFTSFVREMLPLDILQALEETAGGSEFLEDYWTEKYEEVMTKDVTTDAEGCDEREKSCAICEREVRLTRHHLFPRETHSTLIKRGQDKKVLSNTIPVCRLCHSSIHRFFTNKELAASYNTVDALMADEKIFKYANWASKLSNSRHGGRPVK